MLDGMKNCSVLIERFTLSGAIGGIEHALFPDLKQELASVVRIFLHHAVWSASDPHVVVLIEVTAVEACFEKLGIAPRINHVARGINLNYERSHAPGVQVDVQDILPIEDEYVVLAIHADSAQPSKHPSVWQRLRPGQIDLVLRRSVLRMRRRRTKDPSTTNAVLSIRYIGTPKLTQFSRPDIAGKQNSPSFPLPI